MSGAVQRAVGGAEGPAPRGPIAIWMELLRTRVAVMVFLTAALGGWLATRDSGFANLARCAEAGL